MSVLDWLSGKPAPPVPLDSLDPAERRRVEWEKALAANKVPGFVGDRLQAAAERKTPWVATMTPAELLLARNHGIRPVAMVSGTCWFQYGYSWSQGHAEGWRRARARLQQEAALCGANAVVNIRMRRAGVASEQSMDYTLLGTAVRVERLPPSAEPILATVPALEFVRLLQAGIVPAGIAVGAHDGRYFGSPYFSVSGPLGTSADRRQVVGQRPRGPWRNQPMTALNVFWEAVRRQALLALRQEAARQGGGALAPVLLASLVNERGRDPFWAARCIAIGTVLDSRRGASVRPPIVPVVDMRDTLSPLARPRSGIPAASEGSTENECP